jgi:DNA-binding CsgD family transcriptional regulator
MNNNFYLYGLFCPKNNELKYVGITTCNIDVRLREHIKSPNNFKIEKWIKNLRKINLTPEIKILKRCETYDELLQCEILEIKKCRDNKINILNLTDGGDINPMFGKTHTDESKIKISKAHKGRKKFKNRPKRTGWSHSKETKRKISNNHIKKGYGNKNGFFSGCKHSDKTKELMSINNSGENNPMFGKKLSKETLKKRSEKVKKLGIYKGCNNPNYKYDINKETLLKYYIIENKTIKEISEIFNCHYGTIQNKLKYFNIKKGKSNKYNLNITDILKYRATGKTLKEIGLIYGCSNKIIHKYIKNNT